MKNPRIVFPFFLVFCLFWTACKEHPSQTAKPVLHFFSDAAISKKEGIVERPANGEALRSLLTYPVFETLWTQDWQGKKALRFESSEAGELRGSLYMLHETIQQNFRTTLNNWLDADAPETWSGFCFWMQDTNKHAVGVRWSAQKSKKNMIVQIFKYDFPHVRSLVQRTFPFEKSYWESMELAVENNRATLKIGNFEPFFCLLDPAWHIGDRYGLFQGQGTGYYADINVQYGDKQRRVDDLFPSWNQEISQTCQKVLLDTLNTPDDFVGFEIPIRRIMISDEWRNSVPVFCPSELSFKATAPPQAVLHASYGILPAFSLSNATAEFRVGVRSSDRIDWLYSSQINPAKALVNAFRYQDIHLSLDAYAGREIEIVFQVNRIAGDDPLIACWGEPTMGKKGGKKPYNVLLVLLDTLRADRVGIYGNQRNLTPYIDQVAKGGTTFLQTVAQAPWTVPSHASFFTSLYPSETGCDRKSTEGNILQESYLTWAEYLQREGYATVAFTTGGAIRGFLNLTQGFDAYQDVVYSSAYSMETIYERFRDWRDERDGEPWFAFLHTYAVHFPYEHEQYVDYRPIFRDWNDHRQYLNDIYDGGVRYADEWVGSLIRYLQQMNEMDSTLIIIASDHGEDLGERWLPRPDQHGHTLYDELLLVPLIFHLPGVIPKDRKITKQVRLIDMLPTVLDLLHYNPPAFAHGMSLAPLMEGKAEGERYAFSEGLTYGVAQGAIRTKDYKYIFVTEPRRILDIPPTGIPVPEPEPIQLYDLRADPGEHTNRASQNPERVKEIQNLLEYHKKLVKSADFFTNGSNIIEPSVLADRVIEEMSHLGYIAK